VRHLPSAPGRLTMAKAPKTAKLRLNSEQKHLIVAQLACYVRTPEIVDEFEKTYGIRLERNHVQRYDPTKSWNRDLGASLTELFFKIRKDYEEGLLQMHPISKRVYRIDHLGKMFEHAYDKKNHPLAAQLLKQAADEMSALPSGRNPKGKPGGASQDEADAEESAGFDAGEVEVENMRQVLGDAILTALQKSGNAPSTSTKQ